MSMIKLLWRIALMVIFAMGLVWLAERPGTVTVHWLGQDAELSVFFGVMALLTAAAILLVVVWILRRLWAAPSVLRGSLKSRREKKAYEALSRGIIAAGAGDGATAARHVAVASSTLKHEPLVHLLQAHAAQLRGDKAEVTRLFGGMSKNEETALFGLRGLYTQARERGDWHEAQVHAKAAHSRNGRLAWAQHAMLHSLIMHKDWRGAARIIEQMAKAGSLPKADAAKKQAALVCAAALATEVDDKGEALKLAIEAHSLDSALAPAALVMARIYINQNQPKRALKALRETWTKQPQRGLAEMAAAAYDDTPEDQYERVRSLVGGAPTTAEGRIVLARYAMAAKRFDAAREILASEIAGSPPASVCAMMAEIEEVGGEPAKARSWLVRALSAASDPMWVSDGVALAQWSPVSPVTAEILPCEWRSPLHKAASYQLSLPPAQPVSVAKAEVSTAAKALRPPDDPGVE